MSGSTFQVKPGAPQQLSGANLATGTTLYNTDTANSIWVSTRQAVSPGNGFEIQPLAYLEWSTPGQVWACVDSGVITPVTLVISDDVQNYQNPLGIALAIASKGVPNVLLIDDIVTGKNLTSLSTDSYDVSKYGTIILQIVSNNTAEIEYTFSDSVSGVEVDEDTVSGVTLSGQAAIASIQVRANQLAIFNPTGFPVTYSLFGTNRVSDTRLDTRTATNVGDRWTVGSSAKTSGTTYPLAQNGIATQLQGLVFVDYHINDATRTLTGDLQLVDSHGNTVILVPSGALIRKVGGLGFGGLVALPGTGYSVVFQCDVAGTGAITANFEQATI